MKRRFDRNKICYHDVKTVERNDIEYWVEIFGDGTYFAAYAGLSEEDEKLQEFKSKSENTAIEV